MFHRHGLSKVGAVKCPGIHHLLAMGIDYLHVLAFPE
jgi:hypothetical protein